MATGWTGGLIAPNMRVHDAAHAAIDSTGGSTSAIVRGVLRDPTLGSRSITGAPAPLGVPVGSASVYQNNGVPNTILSAMANLNTNTQNQTLADILNKVLQGISGGGGAGNASADQDALARARTAQVKQQTAFQALPGQLNTQIQTLQQQNPQRMGITSVTPALPGQYNPEKDNALQNLYGQLSFAKQQASGWTAPIY